MRDNTWPVSFGYSPICFHNMLNSVTSKKKERHFFFNLTDFTCPEDRETKHTHTDTKLFLQHVNSKSQQQELI
jgi:hypothetical protein